MVTYWSRIFARDLFEKKEINKLYEIVYLYGTYLYYKEEEIEKDFLSYYKENRSFNRDCFINTANRKATEYFDNFFISSRKMRRLIISSNRVVKRSYDWMPEYVNFILAECMNVDELREIIVNDIFTACGRCRDIIDVDMYVFNFQALG